MAQMMRLHTLTGRDPIGILLFFRQFRYTCDVKNVHEGATLWVMKHFLYGSTSIRLTTISMRKNMSAPTKEKRPSAPNEMPLTGS